MPVQNLNSFSIIRNRSNNRENNLCCKIQNLEAIQNLIINNIDSWDGLIECLRLDISFNGDLILLGIDNLKIVLSASGSSIFFNFFKFFILL